MANMEYRKQLVLAMEFVARQVTDEQEFMRWLTLGVPDGDVEYGNLTDTSQVDDILVEEDEYFAELMCTFLRTMSSAYKNGGLYCDGVVSKED